MSDRAGDHQAEAGPRGQGQITVLWAGCLLCAGQVFDCVVEKISAQGALLRVADTSMCHMSVTLRIPRLGDLSSKVIWRNTNKVGIRFLDKPERIARMIGEILP